MSPLEMIEGYSADAVRYWAASTGLGKDAIISEEKVHIGAKLVTKLWNVARFSQRFLAEYAPPAELPRLSPADRWILARLQRLVARVTELWRGYDYAAAKSETETFFWRDLADNYLEMAKVRLYGEQAEAGEGARYALYHVLLATLKLFAPIIPYVTEEIYQALFVPPARGFAGHESIHRSPWPAPDARLQDQAAEALGETLIEIATSVRRYKSEHNLPLGAQIERLQLATGDADLSRQLRAAVPDISSITRAGRVELAPALDPSLQAVQSPGDLLIALCLA
jgi:valyl-tRNA synthetase